MFNNSAGNQSGFFRPGPGGNSDSWDLSRISNFFESVIKVLPEGRARKFFEMARNDLNPGVFPITSSPTEFYLHPISAKEFHTPIIIDREIIPGRMEVTRAVISTRDGTRSFEIEARPQNNFLIFLDKDDTLTYKEAYIRLGITSIACLKISFL